MNDPHEIGGWFSEFSKERARLTEKYVRPTERPTSVDAKVAFFLGNVRMQWAQGWKPRGVK